MTRTITAATLIVHYSYQLSDADIQKIAKRIPGGTPYTMASLIILHPKFTLDIKENRDGTFELTE